MEEKTLSESDIERVRGYVVDVLITQFMHFGYTRKQIAEISREVLQKTKGVSTLEQLTNVLHELAEKYPQLRIAEVKEAMYNAHKVDSTRVTMLMEVLSQGDFDRAVDLVHQYESGKS